MVFIFYMVRQTNRNQNFSVSQYATYASSILCRWYTFPKIICRQTKELSLSVERWWRWCGNHERLYGCGDNTLKHSNGTLTLASLFICMIIRRYHRRALHATVMVSRALCFPLFYVRFFSLFNARFCSHSHFVHFIGFRSVAGFTTIELHVFSSLWYSEVSHTFKPCVFLLCAVFFSLLLILCKKS